MLDSRKQGRPRPDKFYARQAFNPAIRYFQVLYNGNMSDTQSVVSDVKLFLEKLKQEMPEIFGPTQKTDGQPAPADAAATPAVPQNRVLYNGDLFEARVYLTPDQDEGVTFDGTVFHIYLQTKEADPAALVTAWLRQKADEVLKARTKEWAEKIGVEYNNIVLKDQKTLWASCSGKKISTILTALSKCRPPCKII